MESPKEKSQTFSSSELMFTPLTISSSPTVLNIIYMWKKNQQLIPGSSDGKKKNLSAVQETLVRSLGLEDPLEKEMATHPCILA